MTPQTRKDWLNEMDLNVAYARYMHARGFKRVAARSWAAAKLAWKQAEELKIENR